MDSGQLTDLRPHVVVSMAGRLSYHDYERDYRYDGGCCRCTATATASPAAIATPTPYYYYYCYCYCYCPTLPYPALHPNPKTKPHFPKALESFPCKLNC